MVLTRQKIESIVRNTYFIFGDKRVKLGSDDGYDAISEELLNEFIEQAVTDSGIELQDIQVQEFTNCVPDSNKVTIPDAALFVTDVIRFADYDDTDPPDADAETAYHSGTPLRKATSHAELRTYRAEIEDHGIITETSSQNLTGKPAAYMQWSAENDDGERYNFIEFDRAADHGYYLLVQFIAIPDSMSSDSSQVNVTDIYQWVFVQRTRCLVAESIGDDAATRRFERQYEAWMRKYRKLIGKRNTPETTQRFAYYS